MEHLQMQDGEPNVYAGLATLRNGYMQSQWQRVAMFLVLNAGALPVVLGTAYTGDLKLTLCYVALITHILIITGTIRAEMWIRQIDLRLAILEKLDEGSSRVRIALFSDLEFAKKRDSIFASRRIFFSLWIITAGFWSNMAYARTYAIFVVDTFTLTTGEVACSLMQWPQRGPVHSLSASASSNG
jgi:hypothetical protein